jgi:hypothetical protein
LNKDHYDLIIDSTKIVPQEVVNKIIKHLEYVREEGEETMLN